ncbi:BBE domain-containing protein [Streptomyces sp. NPDC059679]|uniref:BBE domain-containing protein n=1 Tax=Streptomyces sp. NPDC059679 TaxID=3346903 RepID=UPI0036C37C95
MALRGGGGNFGVVTAFEYRAHPLGPDVVSGQIVFPDDQATAVLGSEAKYRRLAEIKAVWDPRNLLRHNNNIAPAPARRSLPRAPRPRPSPEALSSGMPPSLCRFAL